MKNESDLPSNNCMTHVCNHLSVGWYLSSYVNEFIHANINDMLKSKCDLYFYTDWRFYHDIQLYELNHLSNVYALHKHMYLANAIQFLFQ